MCVYTHTCTHTHTHVHTHVHTDAQTHTRTYLFSLNDKLIPKHSTISITCLILPISSCLTYATYAHSLFFSAHAGARRALPEAPQANADKHVPRGLRMIMKFKSGKQIGKKKKGSRGGGGEQFAHDVYDPSAPKDAPNAKKKGKGKGKGNGGENSKALEHSSSSSAAGIGSVAKPNVPEGKSGSGSGSGIAGGAKE